MTDATFLRPRLSLWLFVHHSSILRSLYVHSSFVDRSHSKTWMIWTLPLVSPIIHKVEEPVAVRVVIWTVEILLYQVV
jgi:hypothetical protein